MIAILQPHIPHYREAFFLGVGERANYEIYCYESESQASINNFKNADIATKPVKGKKVGPFFWYTPAPFLKKDVDEMVLMLDFKHLTSWWLLFTKFIHKKKIILWGQGISIKGFLKYEKKPFFMVKWMLALADGAWFYTENEYNLYKKYLPKLNAASLNNTISGVDEILGLPKLNALQKAKLKVKHKITQPVVLIFCARFNDVRRVDLLLEVMNKVDRKKFGFIIIGDGPQKPSFAEYTHVYDFGKVYDFDKKSELFSIADIYFQPAWLGLSIVEAMAYAKPIFSFKRSETVFQCVEYTYVKDGFNGKLFNAPHQLLQYLDNLNVDETQQLGNNAQEFVKYHLSMVGMVNNALSVL